jgi:peroxiredoxin
MSLSIKVVVSVLGGFLIVFTVARAGDPLIGTPAREWQLTDWINSPAISLKDQRGKVVLVRWWTGDGCPFCAATAPALNEFHTRYFSKGLVVVGVYHHKGRGLLKTDQVKQNTREFGFQFPVAVDPDWQTLKRWWLNDSDRRWTSVTFLIDRKGIIRHIHPGGSYVNGDEAYGTMKSKIEQLLMER